MSRSYFSRSRVAARCPAPAALVGAFSLVLFGGSTLAAPGAGPPKAPAPPKNLRRNPILLLPRIVPKSQTGDPGSGQVDVLTYHNDLARTGQDLNEVLLTPASVSATRFGKRFTTNVDGQVYAQPLYKAGVVIAGQGRHNVVFVATEHDSVYAFDAESGATLWHTSFIAPPDTVPMSQSDAFGCSQITPEIGITGTPVIDPDTNTLYVVATTKENATGSSPHFAHRLHALDIGSGTDRILTGASSNIPGVEVQATYPGTASDGNNPDLTFAPQYYKERTGLLLLNGVVYTSWASHCDVRIYHGWMIGYDAHTLQQVCVYNDTPETPEGGEDSYGASFWASGAAPAVDASGNIFMIGGNGTYNPADGNFGDCFLRLVPSGNSLATADYFAPSNQDYLNAHDLDLGSSGALLLPDSVGTSQHPRLLVSAGKEGRLYLIDRDNMGKLSTNDVNTLQSQTGVIGALFGIPAYFNNQVYISSVGNRPKAFAFSYDGGGGVQLTQSAQAPESFGYPGSVPSISASGTQNGLVWAIDPGAVLRAYDAGNIATELYNSSQAASSRDSLGSYVKYSVPTITNGRVYVGTASTFAGFGLLSPTAATDATARMTIARGSLVYQRPSGHYAQLVTITNNSGTTIVGPVSLSLDGLTDAATLASARGTTSYTATTGSFYQNADNNPASLAPGQQATFKLDFADPSGARINYTARILTGAGSR